MCKKSLFDDKSPGRFGLEWGRWEACAIFQFDFCSTARTFGFRGKPGVMLSLTGDRLDASCTDGDVVYSLSMNKQVCNQVS